MNSEFKVSVRGTSFATRTRAEELVDEITKIFESNPSQCLNIDFTDVKVISPSFTAAFIRQLNSILNRPSFKNDCIKITVDSPLIRDRLLDTLDRYCSLTKFANGKQPQSQDSRILVSH